MVESSSTKNLSILIVDDNKEIHEDLRKILGGEPSSTELESMEAALFGIPMATNGTSRFELSDAYQGSEAFEKVRSARRAGKPYALIFVDIRMPPGWDGVEALSRVFEEDKDIQGVICTAYSDYSWADMTSRLGQTDRLLVLKKPFDPIEVRQIATALTEKWNQHAELIEMSHRIRQQNVAMQVLMAAATLPEGGAAVLRLLGEELVARLGSMWIVDPERGDLRCVCVWNGGGAVAEIEQATLSAQYPVPRGLLERLYSGFFSLRVLDEDGTEPRLRSAARVGVRTALLFPLRCAGKTIGAFEFLHESREVLDAKVAWIVELCDSVSHFVNSKLMEIALQKSEAKHRALLDAIPDVIYRIRRDGEYLDYRAGRSLPVTIGAPPKDGEAKRGPGALAPEIAARFLLLVEQTLSSGGVRILEYSESCGEETRHYEARGIGSGADEALVIVRDITDRKVAEADREKRALWANTMRVLAEALASLSTPLILLGREIVLMPLVGEVDVKRAAYAQKILSEGIAATGARIAILDVTGVPKLDAEFAHALLRAAQSAQLLGSEIIITGIQPDIAQTLVTAGVELQGIMTFPDVASGLAFALARR